MQCRLNIELSTLRAGGPPGNSPGRKAGVWRRGARSFSRPGGPALQRQAIICKIFFAALCVVSRPIVAQDQPTWQTAAKALQHATATVRIWNSESEKPAVVTVCTGLCVTDGLIVTAATAGSDSPIRLTLPGGKQADAKIKLIDEYSGLALLKADTSSLTPLLVSVAAPAVRNELLSAAACG